MNEKLIIFGCGGVGSHLAYMLCRLPKEHPLSPTTANITLVDFDNVEAKNCERQMFGFNDIGRQKTQQIKQAIIHYYQPEDLEMNNIVVSMRKIASFGDLATLDRNALAIICTDNVSSKRIIGTWFDKKLIVNCDSDYYEIKTALDSEEMNAIEIDGGGYTSTQNFTSNIMASVEIYNMLNRGIYRNVKAKLTEKGVIYA